MKFSIICPVFNGERYLSEAIESVFSQSYENWELIIVDDCSGDDSNSIANNFSDKDFRIKVIKNNTNKGQFYSRIEGIKKSSGEAVVFLDSDDKLKSNCLETLFKLFNKYQNIECITYNCCQLLEDNLPEQNIDDISEKKLINSGHEFYKTVFVEKTIPTVWRYCFKRNALDRIIKLNLSCDTKLGEDMFFLTAAVLNTSRALLITESVYEYRLNKNSICHTLDSNKAFDRFKSKEASYRYINFLSPDILKEIPFRVVNIISWSVAKYLELGSVDNDKQLFKMRCTEIKHSFIWKKFVKTHKFESRYPNLLLTCFKFRLLFLIRYIVKKYKNN